MSLCSDRYTYIKSTTITELKERVPADRRLSFASWIMVSLKPEMLVVEDLTKDKRQVSVHSGGQNYIYVLSQCQAD